ncbi:MAG: prepilin-type N-terminal cleavage/methylation domain-containing protein [Myxococcota bacterium]|jgi:prepilin-type N-terminal cleavage/methylation domain-containing protein
MASSVLTTTFFLSKNVRQQSHSSAFTLLELMVVMVMIGIVAGIGMAGFDRIEPGRSSLQAAVENFIESSRDRARASNQTVVLSLNPATEQEAARWQRLVFRNVFEASFEASAQIRENVQLEGQAQLEVAGRCGACLDLSEGGVAVVNGRGTPNLSEGFVVDFDCYPLDTDSGQILNWSGILSIEQLRNGVLICKVRAGNGDFFSDITLETAVGSLQALRWQHIRIVAANGKCALQIDGREVASAELPEYLSAAQDVPVFGDDNQPWLGKIDEFFVQSRNAELGPQVPDDVQMIMSSPTISFDRFGGLADSHSDDVLLVVESFGEELSKFVIGRFSQEVID